MTITVKKMGTEGAEEKLDASIVLSEATTPAIVEFSLASLTAEEQAVVTAFVDLVKAKAV